MTTKTMQPPRATLWPNHSSGGFRYSTPSVISCCCSGWSDWCDRERLGEVVSRRAG